MADRRTRGGARRYAMSLGRAARAAARRKCPGHLSRPLTGLRRLEASARDRGRHRQQEEHMLLIRDIMYCKPGKVRPMVEKFVAMAKLNEKKKMPRMRVMTDVSAERYWTVVS